MASEWKQRGNQKLLRTRLSVNSFLLLFPKVVIRRSEGEYESDIRDLKREIMKKKEKGDEIETGPASIFS